MQMKVERGQEAPAIRCGSLLHDYPARTPLLSTSLWMLSSKSVMLDSWKITSHVIRYKVKNNMPTSWKQACLLSCTRLSGAPVHSGGSQPHGVGSIAGHMRGTADVVCGRALH